MLNELHFEGNLKKTDFHSVSIMAEGFESFVAIVEVERETVMLRLALKAFIRRLVKDFNKDGVLNINLAITPIESDREMFQKISKFFPYTTF